MACRELDGCKAAVAPPPAPPVEPPSVVINSPLSDHPDGHPRVRLVIARAEPFTLCAVRAVRHQECQVVGGLRKNSTSALALRADVD